MAPATAATARLWPTTSAFRRSSRRARRSRSFSPTRSAGHAAGLRHHPGNFLPAEDGVFLPFPLGPDAHRRAGFVHEVDGLIRQTAPRQIPHRKLHGLPQGFVGQADAVIPLVAGCQTFQYIHSLLRRRLFDLDAAKSALEGGVLLDVGAEFLIRRRADELQFTPGQHRL